VELLRALIELQDRDRFLSNESLRELSDRRNVPLYRLEGLVSFYPHFRRTPPPRVSVNICRDVTCQMAGCESLRERLQTELAERVEAEIHDVEICEVSCLGRCESAPAIDINGIPGETTVSADIGQLIQRIDHPETIPDTRTTVNAHRWKCDPYSSPAEHFGTVRTVLNSEGDLAGVCIGRLKQAGLTGMGGAGFPTGTKWELVAGESADTKYVICNADESEPGTFKDRVILEQLPHLVIEGMLLAGLTIGAERGIVFLRHEYGRARQAIEAALQTARSAGVLGENAAGSGRVFDIELFISPGGYILGEETALLEALEDKRGEPRNKPPYPGTYGLWGQPTLINNVETFALSVPIVHHGPEWWVAQGLGESSGLKFVSVSGDVTRPGVYEIPLGTTVADLIKTAGGMQEGKTLKAFLPGGASSNFLPASRAETPLDFKAMKQAGSMLGTGAVVVMNEERNLFALAANLVRFFRNESCGKCVPCRLGTAHAVELLENVKNGSVAVAELSILDELGRTLEQTSICGLGQVALNPILSMMKHFPDDVPGAGTES